MRRLVALVLLLLGITFVAFVLTELVPSNAAATNLGEQAAGDPAAVAAFKQHYGLDKPLPVRYAIYLGHVLHGDLGQSSLTHDAVTHDLGQFIPATAELALYSILFASVVGVAFGVLAALRRNRPTDHALRVASLAGISMPTFWIALVALYVGFYRLGWFPGAERLDPGTCAAADGDRPLHGRRAARRQLWASSARRSTISCCRRSCSPRSTSACSPASRARRCSR